VARDKVFISYSHKDIAWLKKIRTMLKPLEDSGRLLFWDDTRIAPGTKWRDEIQLALNSAQAAVLLVTDNFLASDFVVCVELPQLLKAAENGGLRLFAILVSHCLYEQTPLKDFQFANDVSTPLDSLSVPRQKKLLAEIFRKLTAPAPPHEGNSSSTSLPSALMSPRADIFRLPLTDYTLFGREQELQQLENAWTNSGVKLVELVAFGGTGKTALVNHFLRDLQNSDWSGATRVFGWSFFNQGGGEDKQLSSEFFIAEALRFFGVADPGPIAAWEKGKILAEAIRSQRVLLVLDGVEPLQEPPGIRGGALRDQGLLSLLLELATDNTGLCIVTTRVVIEDLKTVNPGGLLQLDLEQLTPAAGAEFLRHLGVLGAEEELREAVRDFGGHALALRLLGNYVVEVYEGDVRRRHNIRSLTDDEQFGHYARRVMASYEEWFAGKPELQMLLIMGLFDRPVEPDVFAVLRRAPSIAGLTDSVFLLDDVKWRYALGRLRKVGLITEQSSNIDCHPLVREHFAKRLQILQPEASREAHARLFSFFRDKPSQQMPNTLEGLEPLFRAVSHGCRSGRNIEAFREVYWTRISRAEQAFCTHELGAAAADLSVIQSFFITLWVQLADGYSSAEQAWLFNQTGYDLRAVGRIAESLQPIEAGLKLALTTADWKNAARCANNLSRICLMLGEVSKAIEHAKSAVDYADRSGDRFHSLAYRSNLAHALYQGGSLAEAGRLFLEVESELQNQKPSNGGEIRENQYWDLLLGQGQFKLVRELTERSIVYKADRPLDAALDQLSYARARLLEWETTRDMLTAQENVATEEDIDRYLTQAVTGLREAGRQHEIPRGLLARASFRRLQGHFTLARMDIDEALALAQRTGMKLHEVDCYLELTRLALANKDRERACQTWEEASAGIERTGYLRRSTELAELKAML
jgi:tetratricopeptide (TPR) repeat protein